MLIVGSVDISGNYCAEYRICNMMHISEIVLPIFDKYPLLTSKQYDYEKFRNSLLIYLDKNLSKEQKDEMISGMKASIIPNDYQSYV